MSLLSDGIHCSYVFPAEYDVPLNADWKTVTWKEGKLLHLPRRPTAWVEGDAPGWERQELGDCSDEQEDARPAPEGTKKPPWDQKDEAEISAAQNAIELAGNKDLPH